jgi:hypothetical protein
MDRNENGRGRIECFAGKEVPGQNVNAAERVLKTTI